ncbi:hypothetical protein LRP67_17460 [Nocardioides sp. cx-169]|uniref:hypothetical protein n=1 Tax=Nocardioides sp. cx-169 TaxID=2899080 RepID=UPI001E5CE4B7|nr:hypothetical protein [Nocardioides sp. cx-169]MCD4535878.1 hypothetical protein [Nocardioides sp. cx-169]
MELHQISEPTGDPFFDALRRRHPDVDVVLLPPESPPAPPGATVDEAAANAVLARVQDLAGRLWSGAAGDSEESPRSRYRYGAGPGAVRAVAGVATRRGDGFHVLVALRHALESEGGALTRPPGAVERLVAHLDDLTVTASYAEEAGALLCEVSSESLEVGPDAARRLVRGGGR